MVAKLLDKEVKNAILSKTTTALTAATTALDNTTNGTVAKTLKTETDTLGTKNATLTAAATAWKTKALLTVAAMKNWLAAEVYTAGTADRKCDATGGCVAKTEGNGSDTLCKGECTKLNAWGMVASLPAAAAVENTAHCYGIQFANSNCALCNKNDVKDKAGAESGYKCYKRAKSALGKPLYDANELSKSGGSLLNTYDSAMTAWLTQGTVVDTAQSKVNIATEYKTKVNTDKTAKSTASGTADTDYTTANTALTALGVT